MKKGIILILLMVIAASTLWLGCGGCGGGDDEGSDGVTPISVPTSGVVTDGHKDSSPEPTTPAPTSSPSATSTETAAPGPTPGSTVTQTPVPTATTSPTSSPTPSPTATVSPTPSPTPGSTAAPSPTPTPTQDGEVVSFPDSNLAAAIRTAISKPSGDILISDLAGLTTLNAPNRGISDLTGLQACTALSYIDLSHNAIEDISPLVANTGLGSGDTVHLEYNPLSSQSYGYVSQLTGRGVEVIWGSL